MSTRDLIDAIQAGDSVEIENTFNSIMATKVSDRIDAMRSDVAQTMFASEETVIEDEEESQDDEELTLEDYSLEELEDYMMSEEFEQLDELSKTTLGNYVKKASVDSTISRKIAADFEHRGDRAKKPSMKASNYELEKEYKRKSWKRRDNINKAVDRLTK